MNHGMEVKKNSPLNNNEIKLCNMKIVFDISVLDNLLMCHSLENQIKTA